MDLHDTQAWLTNITHEISVQFSKVPGSAIFLRYVKSSYQDDPIRSAVELFLFLFAVRYLLAPTYKPQSNSFVKLSDEVPAKSASHNRPSLKFLQEIDELVDDWTPEPLVAPQTAFEEAENEKRPVIVGYYTPQICSAIDARPLTVAQPDWPQVKARKWPYRHQPGLV